MKTPLSELLERLEEIYDANPMEPDYREGISDAMLQARKLLSIERSHICAAWRDGSEGILNQSADGYLNEVYGRLNNLHEEA